MVSRFSENDITDKKQTEEIQKGLANGISAGGNHNHAIITTRNDLLYFRLSDWQYL
jgi:hypothetical protein